MGTAVRSFALFKLIQWKYQVMNEIAQFDNIESLYYKCFNLHSNVFSEKGVSFIAFVK